MNATNKSAVFLFFGSMLVLAACSGSSTTTTNGSSGSSGGGAGDDSICETKGKCPNESAPSASSVAKCKAQINDAKCGAVTMKLYECVFAKEVCAANGGADTSKSLEACASEYGALIGCGPSAADAGSDARTDSNEPTDGG